MPLAPTPVSGDLAHDEPQEYLWTMNLGPQHPATHTTLRLVLKLDGERVTHCVPHLGYLHRGMEKIAENRTYLQFIPYTDRMDYLSPLAANVGFALAVEELLGVQVPPRCEVIRVICCELARIGSHQLWLGTHALDLGAGTVKDITSGTELTFGKIPNVMLKILDEGGLIPYIQKHGDFKL